MSARRGLDAKLYVNGTLIAFLTGIDFSWECPSSEFAGMGTAYATDAFLGVKHYRGAFRRAYVDNQYTYIFQGGTKSLGSLVPVTGRTIVGTLLITGGSITNMETEETAAVIEEGTFIMYSVTFA